MCIEYARIKSLFYHKDRFQIYVFRNDKNPNIYFPNIYSAQQELLYFQDLCMKG